jgi:hypothetical protein
MADGENLDVRIVKEAPRQEPRAPPSQPRAMANRAAAPARQAPEPVRVAPQPVQPPNLLARLGMAPAAPAPHQQQQQAPRRPASQPQPATQPFQMSIPASSGQVASSLVLQDADSLVSIAAC